MKNYKNQNGCHNCWKVFIKTEYEDYPEYFCTMNAFKRPPCLSYLMDDNPDSGFEPENGSAQALSDYTVKEEAFVEKLINDWDEWAKGREVNPHGICDLWLIKVKENYDI